ncbi:MAG: fumarylacetoacetate hydrolase family protein [Anaerolineae bacterium]|nr:fumarylacetoacetate hydrolase family protein [Anaerolineae bacterium]
MKLVQYITAAGAVAAGELVGETVYALSVTVLEALTGAQPPARGPAVPAPHLVAPLRPGKILCVGRNYAEHAAELNNDVPKTPLIFAKYSSSVIGPGAAITWRSAHTQQVDWEGELAVVIGRTARRVPEADALDCVAGYTLANDVSARDLQASESQWLRAKSMDTFCPLGPCIVSRAALPDPHALTLTTTVSGQVMQHGHTGAMIFRIPYLVAYLSETFTLEPGDIILTGTPAGVGKGMKPPRFLTTGDTVSVSIAEIGTLSNPCLVQD